MPPTTPYLEHMPLPAENDGPEYDRDKRAVDGEMRRGVGGKFQGHHDRDHDHEKILHYSDITITINSASEDDETRPGQVLMTSQQQPTPQLTTTNPSFQTPTFPKDVKKERSSLRKKLVRIKLQLTHYVDDLKDIFHLQRR